VPDAIAITIRPAQANDAKTIKAMVSREHLDPTSLKWQNFMVAEHNGQIVGIGQIKRYRDCNELGSLVTVQQYRGQGIAAQIIHALEAQVEPPLYLLCRSTLERFYGGFGYKRIDWQDAPTPLKLKLLPTFLFRLFGIRILVMVTRRLHG
jgi:N-acetylglutamate synthase-like GNAT family acetyltransferase